MQRVTRNAIAARMVLIALMTFLSGCTSNSPAPQHTTPVNTSQKNPNLMSAEKTYFKMGRSSITVEKLAMQQQCDPTVGARLVSNPGPIEYYRVHCRDGKDIAAYCELGECALIPKKAPVGSATTTMPVFKQ